MPHPTAAVTAKGYERVPIPAVVGFADQRRSGARRLLADADHPTGDDLNLAATWVEDHSTCSGRRHNEVSGLRLRAGCGLLKSVAAVDEDFALHRYYGGGRSSAGTK